MKTKQSQSFSYLKMFLLSLMKDDWHLLNETVRDVLIDKKSNNELFIENSSLVLKSKDFKKVIYDFENKNHDIYLIDENNISFIYVFNIDDKNINFNGIEMDFNL